MQLFYDTLFSLNPLWNNICSSTFKKVIKWIISCLIFTLYLTLANLFEWKYGLLARWQSDFASYYKFYSYVLYFLELFYLMIDWTFNYNQIKQTFDQLKSNNVTISFSMYYTLNIALIYIKPISIENQN